MAERKTADRNRGTPPTRDMNEVQPYERDPFRGMLADVCATESSNAANPELCGSEQPVVDDEGHPIGRVPRDVPRSAPKK